MEGGRQEVGGGCGRSRTQFHLGLKLGGAKLYLVGPEAGIGVKIGIVSTAEICAYLAPDGRVVDTF